MSLKIKSYVKKTKEKTCNGSKQAALNENNVVKWTCENNAQVAR